MRLENDIYLHSKNKKKVYQKLKEGGGGVGWGRDGEEERKKRIKINCSISVNVENHGKYSNLKNKIQEI